MPARPRSSAACATSCTITWNPAWANTCAMPLPIVPAPMTPTFLIITYLLSPSGPRD